MTPVEAEISCKYAIDEYGVIQTPGRYRGQQWQVVPFHRLMQQGIIDVRMAALNGAAYDITDQDRLTYSLPRGVQRVEVYENKSQVEIVFK